MYGTKQGAVEKDCGQCSSTCFYVQLMHAADKEPAAGVGPEENWGAVFAKLRPQMTGLTQPADYTSILNGILVISNWK